MCVFRFQLCLNSNEPLNPILEVIENTVKVLCIVSLRFSAGHDADVKKHLIKLREEHAELTKLYEQTKSELTAKLENAENV